MTLDELQIEFSRALLQNDFSNAAEWIDANGISTERRLWVYRNQVHLNWLEALEANYPGSVALLGRSCFRSLAARYARDHGSVSGDLRLYGEQFPALLALAPEVRNFPYVSDVARLELALRQVSEAFEHPTIGPEVLASIPLSSWPSIKLDLVTALATMLSEYPVSHLLAGARGDKQALQIAREQLRDTTGAALIIYRQGTQVVTDLVEPDLWVWIESVRLGKTLDASRMAATAVQPEGSSFDPKWGLSWLFEHQLVRKILNAEQPSS